MAHGSHSNNILQFEQLAQLDIRKAQNTVTISQPNRIIPFGQLVSLLAFSEDNYC